MGVEWLPIFLSALASGLLSLLISDVDYRVSVRSPDRHQIEQLKATAKRHAEQLLVLRTTLLAVETNSGEEAARDEEGKLTAGLHHEGPFIAPPGIATSAVANHLSSLAQDEDDPR
jgi:hypothetical protein